ncbi:hypothetical protein SAMN04488137_1008 [Fictibacillus solisalsi]|uniref:Uncharacterized protein n=1 Tax=Fictibacillus solisalsi TaxID=459525 RepID=A0A1G9UM00_9BACL|nr:hypothetical protein [Fictibacillus solisalsi]SDM60946.1 hypothetical protein SAMN04488137_1008 [Fictibacillus solisalsi]
MSETEVTKVLGITERYSREILDIKNKLHDLESGRIYELTSSRMDGYLATNIIELKKMIADLIFKIDTDSPSENEKLVEALSKD